MDDDDEYADGAEDLDDDPVEGLGELDDCADDQQWCQIVGPADAGGRQ